MKSFDFDSQLGWLNQALVSLPNLLKAAGGGMVSEEDANATRRMILSIAESVKVAREHQGNCLKAPLGKAGE